MTRNATPPTDPADPPAQRRPASGVPGYITLTRGPYLGDQRRTAMLEALRDLLTERDLTSITIADISARAGVTRSAFYFYFANKAACVAALGAPLHESALAALAHLEDQDTTPRLRVERMVEVLFAALLADHQLYRASLEAARGDETIRQMWEEFQQSFVAPVARMIVADRQGGLAPPGPTADRLARMLVDLADRTMTRIDPADPEQVAADREALTELWLRAIYGRAD